MTPGARCAECVRLPNFWVLAVYFLLFGFFLTAMPKFSDDFWFMQFLRPWFETQGVVNPTDGGNILKAGIPRDLVLDSWRWRRACDNMRLCNMVVIVLLLLPKWLGSSVALLSWAYSVMKGFRLAGVDWRRSALVPPALLGYCMILPWYENMGSLVFQFNYVVATALSVWLLVRVLRGAGRGRRYGLCTVLLAFIVGWWHEGFGVPMAVGFMALMILDRTRSNRIVLMCIVMLCVGVAVNILSPGMTMRLARDSHDVNSVRFQQLKDTWVVQWLFIIDMAMLAVMLCFRRYRRRLLADRVIWIMAAVCLSSVSIFILSGPVLRAGWLCAFFSVPLWMASVRALFAGKSLRMPHAGMVSAVLCGVILTAGLLMLDTQVVRLYRQIDRMMTKFKSDPTRQYVFDDCPPEAERPLFMLCVPTFISTITSTKQMGDYMTGIPGRCVYAIPSELEYATPGLGIPLKGNAGFRNCRGHIFAPYDGPITTMSPGFAMIDYGKGYTNVWSTFQIFRSRADGRRYVYIRPVVNWYVAHFKKIRGIEAFNTIYEDAEP